MQAFARLLREHIQKEDRALYPLAERRLSTSAKDEVSVLFERFEAAQAGCYQIKRLRELEERPLASSTREAPWIAG